MSNHLALLLFLKELINTVVIDLGVSRQPQPVKIFKVRLVVLVLQ